MPNLIEPRVLKGFRDFLPDQESERQRIMALLAGAFSSFGFVPIDTPVLEYTEILLGKGGGETDKQVYRFEDQGGRDVAMRYDLTVPFARYMAAHLAELYLPFKRYHMAKAFRGENTQRGRYREFVQCDFDIVGTEAPGADLEIVLMIDRAFRTIGVDEVEIHIAHRGVFSVLLDSLGLTEGVDEVLRAVDKLRKIGEDRVREQLDALVGAEAASRVLELISLTGDNRSVLARMREIVPGASDHFDRLDAILEAASALDMDDRIVLDPAITRGLDYYTGIVFETFLKELPGIGSVCSGGRYDDLAGLYSKQRMPGVGASIGLDRLMAGLEELGVSAATAGAADAIVLCLDDRLTAHYHAIAERLRAAGLRVDVYPESRKLGQQFSFAEKKGIPAAILCGEQEYATGAVNVRELATRENTDGISVEDAIDVVRRIRG